MLYDKKMRSLKDKIADKALETEIEDAGKNELEAAKGKRTKRVKRSKKVTTKKKNAKS